MCAIVTDCFRNRSGNYLITIDLGKAEATVKAFPKGILYVEFLTNQELCSNRDIKRALRTAQSYLDAHC